MKDNDLIKNKNQHCLADTALRLWASVTMKNLTKNGNSVGEDNFENNDFRKEVELIYQLVICIVIKVSQGHWGQVWKEKKSSNCICGSEQSRCRRDRKKWEF